MSQTIENRIVELQFENKQFESGVEESLSTLDKLKKALKLDEAAKSLSLFGKSTKNFDLNDIGSSVEKVSDKFSAFGVVGFTIMQRLTNSAIDLGKKIGSVLTAPIEQAKTGGWTRAMNIEEAKFQLEGLGVAWKDIQDDINFGVQDTAYGLDAAAKAASQLVASGVQVGDAMKHSLLAISGVAAMTSSSYEEISPIFTTVAGQGKLMTMQLRQLESRGLNAAAVLGKAMGKTEAEIRDMVSKGTISFQQFSDAMYEAFGQHAKDANQTFMGAMANVKAALNKIGAEFATPYMNNMVPVLNQVRLFINEIKKSMSEIFGISSNVMKVLSDFLSGKIAKATEFMQQRFTGMIHLNNALKNVITAVVRIIGALKDAFQKVFPSSRNFEQAINNACVGIEKFTEKLIMSDDTLIAFRDVMTLVFTILKKLATVIKFILTIIGKVLSVAFKIIAVVAKIVLCIGQLVSNLTNVRVLLDAIKQSGGLFVYIGTKLRNMFASLVAALSDTNTALGQFAQGIAKVGRIILVIVGGTLYLAFMKIKEIMDAFATANPLETLKNNLMQTVDTLKQIPILGNIVSGIEGTIGLISIGISGIVGFITDLINKVKSGMSVFDAFRSKISGIEGPFERVKTKIDEFLNTHQNLKRTLETIGAIFTKVKDVVLSFFGVIRAKAKDISAGQVLLFAFGGTLTFLAYQAARAFESFSQLGTGVKNFFGELTKAVKNYGKKHSTFLQIMLGISAGLLSLAGAIWVIAQVPADKLQQVVVSLLALIGVIGLFSTISSAIGKGSGAFAVSMISLAAGIAVLIGALYALEGINFENIKTKLIVLGSICAAMLIISAVLAKVAPQFTKGGIAVVLFASAVYILAKALAVISSADLSGIKDSWKELSAVILAFAAFTSIASNVGITSALALLAFLMIFKQVFKHVEAFKKYFGSIQAGITVICDYIKSAFRYFYNAIKQVAEDIEKTKALGWLIQGGTISIITLLTSVILALGHAGKGIKKASVGFALIIATIAGLIFVIAEASKLMNSAKAVNIDKLISVLDSVLIFIGYISTLAILPTNIDSRRGNKTFKATSNAGMLRDLRKTISSIALLVLAIGGFAAMVGSLNEAQFERAKTVLIGVGAIISILALISSLVVAFSSKKGKIDASFNTFAGVVLLIGSLIASIGVLMFMFNGVSWEKDRDRLLMVAAAFVGITAALGIILGCIAKIRKNTKLKKSNNTWATISSLAGLILIIGGIVYLFSMMSKDQLTKAGIIAAALVVFIIGLGVLISYMQKISAKNLNTKLRQGAFKQVMLSLLELVGMVAIIAGVAGLLTLASFPEVIGDLLALLVSIGSLMAMLMTIIYLTKKPEFQTSKKKDFENFKNVMMALREILIEFAALAVVGALVGRFGNFGSMLGQFMATFAAMASLLIMVMAVINLTKKPEFQTSGKTDYKNFSNVMARLRELLIEFSGLATLAVILAKANVDPGAMAKQFGILVTVIAILGGFVLAINYAVKNIQLEPASIAIFEGLIGGLIVLMGVLAGLFAIVNHALPNDLASLAKKLGLIGIVLTVLGGMTYLLTKFSDTEVKNALKAELALLGMIALFTILTLVFMIVNKLKTEGIVTKALTIVACLASLLIIAKLASSLGSSFKDVLIGEAVLGVMIGLFTLLTLVFKMIDKMKTEGILAKSQSIVLCLLELWVIAVLCAFSGIPYVAILSGIGEVVLLAMIGIFAILVQVFKVIDKLKTEGIMKKSQTIILVLLELSVLMTILGGLAPAMFAGIFGAIALLPLVKVFSILSDVFIEINKIKTDGVLKKSQTIILVLLELAAMASIMGILVIAIVAGGIAAWAMKPLINIFAHLAVIFSFLQKVETTGIEGKVKAITKCLWKLVGIASVLGLLFPLAILARLGTPAILEMCEGIAEIAKALKMVGNLSVDKMEKTASILTSTLLKLAGIGVVGIIGGPGLIMLSEGIAMIGMACYSAGKGFSLFSDAIVNIAKLTPQSLNGIRKTIEVFFKSIGNGLKDLAFDISRAAMEIALGIVKAVGQITGLGDAFDFVFEQLRKFISICSKASSAAVGILAVGGAIWAIGKGFYYAGTGIHEFAEALKLMCSIKPEEIDNMKNAIKGLAEGIKEGGSEISKLLLVFWDFIAMAAVSSFIPVGLIALSYAIKILSEAAINVVDAIEKFINSLSVLAKITPEQAENIKTALQNFFDVVKANKETITGLVGQFWSLIGAISVLEIVTNLCSPGLVAVMAALVAVGVAVGNLIVKINTLISNNSIANNIRDIGNAITEQIIAIGNAISIAIATIFHTIGECISSGVTYIYGGIQNIVSGVETKFQALNSNSNKWGFELVSNWARGMLAGIGSAVSAIEQVTNAVAAYIHFTEPDKGMLKYVFQYGQELIENWTGGMLDKIGLADQAGSAAGEAAGKGLVETAKDFINGDLDIMDWVNEKIDLNSLFNMGSLAGDSLGKGLYDSTLPWANSTAGLINSVSSMMNLANRGFKSTIGDFEYQLKQNVRMAQAKVDSITKIPNAYWQKQQTEAMSELAHAKEALDKFNGASKDAALSYDGFVDSLGKTGGAAGGAKDALEDFESSLTSTLEGQMDIFSKFEKKSAMSKTELLENMRSQIKGMAEWANDMQVLAAKGIDKGLYEKLAMMGPQGAEYVGAFKEMTTEELAEANKLWGQSLMLPSTVAKRVTASFNSIGVGIGQGVNAGIVAGTGDTLTAIDDYANAVIEEGHSSNAFDVNSPSKPFIPIGEGIPEGVAKGINNRAHLVFTAVAKLATGSINIAEQMLAADKFEKYGINVINGITNGLYDKDAVARLAARIREIAAAVENLQPPGGDNGGGKPKGGGAGGGNQNSPLSSAGERLGSGFVEGIIEGMDSKIEELVEDTERLGGSMYDSMKTTIAGVAQNLLEDDEFTPVITPVLDLSNVQSGTKTLSNLLSTNNAIAASASLANLQNEQQNVSRLGTTFIQNNYSPKALNRIEIYRQTRNQFAQYKEAMR